MHDIGIHCTGILSTPITVHVKILIKGKSKMIIITVCIMHYFMYYANKRVLITLKQCLCCNLL